MPQYRSPGVYVEEVPSAVRPIAGVGTSTAAFIGVAPNKVDVPRPNPDFDPTKPVSGTTNKPSVTDPFDLPAGRRRPALHELRRVHGAPSATSRRTPATGTSRTPSTGSSTTAAPAATSPGSRRRATISTRSTTSSRSTRSLSSRPRGSTTAAARTAIVDHCTKLEDRFAILDSAEVVETGGVFDPTLLDPSNDDNMLPDNTDYARLLLPVDPGLRPGHEHPGSRPTTGLVYVPPSGHVAGIYARVDTERGVHKAPAERGRPRRARAAVRDQQAAAGRAQPAGRERDPRPERQHPRLGRAHDRRRQERRVEVRQRPAPLPVPAGVDRRRHAVGRLRAQRPAASGRRSRATSPRS